MKRIIFLCLVSSIAYLPDAWAREWIMDKTGNYNLVANGQALTLECHSATVGEAAPLTPEVYYFPSCDIGCKGTYIHDNNSLATVIIDEKTFSIPLSGGDAGGFLLARATLNPDFFEALANAQSISVYSGQITPRFSKFDGITNANALGSYYEDCVGGKK